jgi:hypothetical protein
LDALVALIGTVGGRLVGPARLLLATFISDVALRTRHTRLARVHHSLSGLLVLVALTGNTLLRLKLAWKLLPRDHALGWIALDVLRLTVLLQLVGLAPLDRLRGRGDVPVRWGSASADDEPYTDRETRECR